MKDMGVMIPVGKAIVGARLLLGTLLLAAAFVDLSMAEGGLAEATVSCCVLCDRDLYLV